MMSFMNSEEMTTGGMQATAAVRVQMARESLSILIEDTSVQELFPDMIALATSRLTEKVQQNWPPTVPSPQVTTGKISATSTPTTLVPVTTATTKSNTKEDMKKEIQGDNDTNPEKMNGGGGDVDAGSSEEQGGDKILSKTAKKNAKRRAKAKQLKSDAATSTNDSIASSTSSTTATLSATSTSTGGHGVEHNDEAEA